MEIIHKLLFACGLSRVQVDNNGIMITQFLIDKLKCYHFINNEGGSIGTQW